MNDVFLVHVSDCEANLAHEENAIVLRQREVVSDHFLKQLPASDKFLKEKHSCYDVFRENFSHIPRKTVQKTLTIIMMTSLGFSYAAAS